ncbi:unnamed protein product [Phytophthora fragariaefolia]|uniref:Unnamed protein product n=1 Tax=Phytophthora fragariaefolia TaxID=1490495 RepID=A0A9W7D2M9_9STRA|nr:unnamed protein product [Phytophthora fragariaefolia]
MIRARIYYLNAVVSDYTNALERHIGTHFVMKKSHDIEGLALWQHIREGFNHEQQFRSVIHLREAMDIVDIIVHNLNKGHGSQLCFCDDCKLSRAPERHKERPNELIMVALPKTQFYVYFRRTSPRQTTR